MWVTGTLILIITAALVGMTTTPSDYTVAIVDSACAPLQKTFDAILSVMNVCLDSCASPLFLLTRLGSFFVDVFRDILTWIINSSLYVFQFCAKSCVRACNGLLWLTIDYVTCFVMYFEVFNGLATQLVSFSEISKKWCVYTQDTFNHFVIDIFIEKYIRACLFYCLNICHILLSLPFNIVMHSTDLMLYFFKCIISLPFQGCLGLVKYVLYSFLHPYVCVVYSSCTVGVFVILVPVLLHACRVTNIRPLIRWLCAVAMNTESRNRVLEILQRMATDSRHGAEMMTVNGEIGRNCPDVNISEECVVCFQPDRLMKIVPCGHRTTCRKCLKEIEKINNRCPICREQILFKL